MYRAAGQNVLAEDDFKASDGSKQRLALCWQNHRDAVDTTGHEKQEVKKTRDFPAKRLCLKHDAPRSPASRHSAEGVQTHRKTDRDAAEVSRRLVAEKTVPQRLLAKGGLRTSWLCERASMR